MKLAKRTYSLPSDLVQRLEDRLSPGERSRFIAMLIRHWLDEQEREGLRREIVEGCRDMAAVHAEIDREWSHVSDEVWREIE